ncbi:MAG: hypothetical protein ACLTBV_33440 [Enterocloster bolteae]
MCRARTLEGVESGLGFLKSASALKRDMSVPNKLVVIGGGSTAMDDGQDCGASGNVRSNCGLPQVLRRRCRPERMKSSRPGKKA